MGGYRIHREPEWFDLTKYENQSDLDSIQWSMQLALRSFLFNSKKKKKAKYKSDLEKLFSNPIHCCPVNS